MAANLRVQISGLKELRQACKGTPDAIVDLKQTNKRMAEKVIDWAKPGMPRKTGAFVGGYKGSAIARGGQIVNKVKHAGWNEFGGGVIWHPKEGTYARVPMSGGVRMQKRRYIRMKAAPAADSHYIYPAFLSHEAEIQKLYSEEIIRIFTQYF